MTLEKVHELIAMHIDLGCGYNRNTMKMVAGEVDRDLGLEEKWEIKTSTKFTSTLTVNH